MPTDDDALMELALRKAGAAAAGAVLYSTMEPCSERKSGRKPCAQCIAEAGIKRVVYGVKEPFDPELGIVCRGHEVLADAGIEVVHLERFEARCLDSVKAHLRH